MFAPWRRGRHISNVYVTIEPSTAPDHSLARATCPATARAPPDPSPQGTDARRNACTPAHAPTAIVADNASGSQSGPNPWASSTSVGGYYGTNYQHRSAGTGANAFTWSLNVATAGTFDVYARWTQHPNRATNAKYTVSHAAGSNVVTVNQEAGGGSWNLLGTYAFNAGAATVSLSDEANDYVIADAVMLVPPGAAPNTATWTLSVPDAKNYRVYARWTQHPNRATDAKYTVTHAAGPSTLTVNQMAGGGGWVALGTWAFNAGSASVSLTDQANGYVIADAVMMVPTDAAGNTATWTPNVAQAGSYEVYARWTSHANRATNATYTVTHASGSTAVPVDQQQNGGVWNLLGTFNLSPGTAHRVTLTDEANGYVIADAVRLVPVSVQAQRKLYFVHTDHLNTPRLLADAAGTTVWKWDQGEPFGNNVPDENPSGLGAFDLPLRLPGQYFDKETNLHYNYYRDYDPSIGRYVESDPIGLAAGLNTYAYVDSDPLALLDPSGLEACRGTWRRIKWERFGVQPGVPVPDPGRPVPRGRTVPALACVCFWLCVDCEFPSLYDPSGAGLPTTRGFIFFNPAPAPDNRGSIEVGNQCLCPKPGPETACSCKP